MLCFSPHIAAFFLLPSTLALAKAATENPHDTYRSEIYFRFQCSSISFPQWISILTLCLAPLITHIVFGFEEPIVLSTRHPHWHDRLTQFNPITIIWRWYAIVYRRIRARSWDRADMAASNAVFWDGQGWCGSEQLMAESRAWATKLPEQTHVNWLSGSTLATIAMTLQGVSALITLMREGDWHNPGVPLTQVFNAVAVLSFTRLPASIWLSNEYGYEVPAAKLKSRPSSREMVPLTHGPTGNSAQSPLPKDRSQGTSRQLLVSNTANGDQTIRRKPLPQTSRLQPHTILSARLWTAWSLVSLIGICAYGIYSSIIAISPPGHPFTIITTASALTTRMLYFTLTTSGCCIFVTYILKGRLAETVVPCMNALWYKMLNALLVGLALTSGIISALETKALSNGNYATYTVPPS